MESVLKYPEGKIHKSESKQKNDKLCKGCLLYSSGEIFKSVRQNLFLINRHAIICLCLCFQLRIMYIKKYILLIITFNIFHSRAIGLNMSHDQILKSEEYPRIFHNFQNCTSSKKILRCGFYTSLILTCMHSF